MSESRFTGKQVLGIVLAAIGVLGLGLTLGGLVGYRWGKADGLQQMIAQAPNGSGNQPSGGTQPFNQVPSINFDQPYLGIEFEMLTPDLAASANMTGTTGAIVRSVIANSAADKAGLKVNDVISMIDGAPIDDQHPLRDQILAHQIGDQVTLTIVTGTPNGPTNSHDVKVTLERLSAQQSFNYQFSPDLKPNRSFGQVPQQNSSLDNSPYLGVEFEMLTPQIAARENISGTVGAIIRAVLADSPAEQGGLKRGDIITAIDGTPIDLQHSLPDQIATHQIGDMITLTVVTAANPTQSREVKVTLAPRPADNGLQIPGSLPGVPSPNSPSG